MTSHQVNLYMHYRFGTRSTASRPQNIASNAPSLCPGSTRSQGKGGLIKSGGRSWASLPINMDTTTDEELTFSVVLGRKRQRVLTDSSNESSHTVTYTDNASKIYLAPGNRSIRMIGTAANSVHLKAAKDSTKQEVFCIYNADVDATCDSIVSFVKSFNVKVVSCFDAKTRVPDTKSFRICINKSNRKEFVNKDNWPCNILVREWSFKRALATTKR